MSDAAFNGFCLYGFVGAFYVSVVHMLSGSPGKAELEAALMGSKLALSLLGNALCLDQLESSSWPFTSLELRLLEEDLTAELADVAGQVTESWRWPLLAERPAPEASQLVMVLSSWSAVLDQAEAQWRMSSNIFSVFLHPIQGSCCCQQMSGSVRMRS
ncbi:unnamed protein product [Effrenium voratum]|nr:unnamed protein product [Effrenium voratum]